MKKILASITILIFALFLSGCGENIATPNSTGTNTQGGTPVAPTPDELAKNITSTAGLTELKKLVVIAKNNNNVTVDMKIEVEFYNADGSIAGSDSEDLTAVGPNAEVAVDMYSTPKSFDNYKIYIDAEETDEISYYDKIELVHNKSGKNVAVQVKNNSEDTIEYIKVSVVFYKDDKIVGFEDNIQSDIKPGRSANFTMDCPYNLSYRDINYTSYKVFVNGAYTFNL